MALRVPGSQTRERSVTPTQGSRTLTLDEARAVSDEEEASPEPNDVGVLRLRGDRSARRPPAVRWDNSVVDNEHLGKKKSKICCIYHRPRAVGESSDESDSSSSSSSGSDSDSDNGHHDDNHEHSHQCRHGRRRRAKKTKDPRSVSPNAYERQPVYKTKRDPAPAPSTSS